MKTQIQSNSRVDVIVPCYKYAHLLEECVNSVLEQQGVNVRVLILDDASPDDTERVGRAIAGRDPRVAYRRHETNQRHIATFNEGLHWASGEYTLLLSADDKLTPGALRRAANLMDDNANVGFVYGQAIKQRGDEQPQSSCTHDDEFLTRIVDGDVFLREACTTCDNVVLTPTVVVRTSLQHQLGGYRKELVHAGDFEMWMRFAGHADVGYIDGPQAIYRLHGNNMSDGYSLLADLEQRGLAFKAVFDFLRDRDELRATAMRSLASTAFWAGSHVFDSGDLAQSELFIELAMKIDPTFRNAREYRRLQMKRMIGSRAWRAIRPFAQRFKNGVA